MKKSLKKLLGLLASSLFILGGTYAEQEVTIETTNLGSGVYMLKGQGGNIGVFAGADGVFMIDDQFAPLSEKIKIAITKISDKPIKFLINTHWHGDHTGGNENFAKSGSVIVAHENVRKRMNASQALKAIDPEIPATATEALPVVTFTQQVSFYLNGDELDVIHVPKAHTDGDAIIHFKKANIIHMGDTLFNGMYPFIDVSSGGSVQGYLKNLENVIALTNDKTQIIPGHGGMSNKAELVKYHAMLADIYKNYKILKAQGKKIEDIGNIGISKKYDENFGTGFIKPAALLKFIHVSEERAGASKTKGKRDEKDSHMHDAEDSSHKH